MDILEHFAYLTSADDTRFQVLVYDEDGNPVDSDIAAANELLKAYEQQRGDTP